MRRSISTAGAVLLGLAMGFLAPAQASGQAGNGDPAVVVTAAGQVRGVVTEDRRTFGPVLLVTLNCRLGALAHPPRSTRQKQSHLYTIGTPSGRLAIDPTSLSIATTNETPTTFKVTAR